MELASRFVFLTCRIGAERVVKTLVAREYPNLRFAFSRPGFLTFKTADDSHVAEGYRLECPFARRWGLSLGKVPIDEPDWPQRIWAAVEGARVRAVHVWPRDPSGGDPDETSAPWPEEVRAVERRLLEAAPADLRPRLTEVSSQLPELPQGSVDDTQSNDQDAFWHLDAHKTSLAAGDWVLDCVVVDPGEYWFGCHLVTDDIQSHWIGGRPPIALPKHAVSRAYLKMEEALRWSAFPIPPGARWAELGSAPGGASQALLDRGYEVLGVDPAEMHPAVASHPRFRHLRRRVPQARRREFRKVRWLAADMNVAPGYTLNAVEGIVTYPECRVRGLILTLKLTDWKLVDALPAAVDRIASWGYETIRLRQLWHNRQEICVAAYRSGVHRRD
ncbi:SAM-dependent methyltransferase [Thermostilla marina]